MELHLVPDPQYDGITEFTATVVKIDIEDSVLCASYKVTLDNGVNFNLYENDLGVIKVGTTMRFSLKTCTAMGRGSHDLSTRQFTSWEMTV